MSIFSRLFKGQGSDEEKSDDAGVKGDAEPAEAPIDTIPVERPAVRVPEARRVAASPPGPSGAARVESPAPPTPEAPRVQPAREAPRADAPPAPPAAKVESSRQAPPRQEPPRREPSRPELSRPETRPDIRPDARPDTRQDPPRAGSRPDIRPDARPEAPRSGSRPDWRDVVRNNDGVRVEPRQPSPAAPPVAPPPETRRAASPPADVIADDEPTATHPAAYAPPPPPTSGAASQRGLPPPSLRSRGALPTSQANQASPTNQATQASPTNQAAQASPANPASPMNPADPVIPGPALTPKTSHTLPYFSAVAPQAPDAEKSPPSRPAASSREPRRETQRPGPRTKPKSKRPPAPGAAAGAAPAKRADVPERRPEPPPPPVQPGEFADVHTLFAELAGNHMRPVRDLIIELQGGEARFDYVAICEPAIRSLRRSAEGMELPELCVALDTFGAALGDASRAGGATIGGAPRAALLAAYGGLVQLMPAAFELDPERHRRDGIVVSSILQQVPGVTRAAIDKMYAVGLNSVEMLAGAKTDEVAATTGLSRELAGRVLERIQAYRRENPADPSRTSEREVLAHLVDQLKKLNAEYDRVTDAWTDEAAVRRRQLRVLRSEVVQRVLVILARVGQVDRAKEVERASFAAKVEKIEQYLKEAGAAPTPFR